MAIIRLDCNLNGGDSVTPNNELFYRIYGDIDNYSVPIHTTGTALGDANVTVNNDNVIITGVDGTTNTSFKISAVDGEGNEGILSDAVSGSIIIFEDNFSGTVINTSKWIVNDDDTNGYGTITQNDELLIAKDNPAVMSAIISVTSQPLVSGKVFAIDLGLSIQLASGWSFSCKSEDSQTDFRIKSETSSSVGWYSKSNGTVEVDEAVSLNLTSAKTIKFVLEADGITCYYWDSGWTQLGSSVTGAGDYLNEPFEYYAYILTNAGVMQINMDNVTVSDIDYLTQYPTGYTP